MSHTRESGTRIAGVLVVALIATLGCATRGSPADAAVDGNDASLSCSGDRQCVGNAVYACDGNQVGAQLEVCPNACSLGRCVSSACETAEIDRTSFVGCLFYSFEPDNVATDQDLFTSYVVTNPGPTATTAFLERLVNTSSQLAWVAVFSAPIDPGGSARLPASKDQVSGAGVSTSNAIRIRSLMPVSVAAIHSDDTDPGHTFSSGGTMVWPFQSLGSHYRAMTYPQSSNGGVADLENSLGGAGRIAIVGTQPGTRVYLYPSTTATATDPPSTALEDIELGDGDVFQLYSMGDEVDLSGTEILASAPVAVYSGNMTTSYGRSAPGVHSPDMTHEQMPPYGAWGKTYVAAALPPQAGVCDPLLGPGASLWRILAGTDRTVVTFDPPNRTDLPGPATLDMGQVLEFVATGSFALSASAAVLLTQGMDCEPTLSLGISTDGLLQDFMFGVLPGFDQLVSVARTNGAPVLLDGTPIDEQLYVPAGSTYEVAQVSLPACTDSAYVCTHRLTTVSGRFGASLRGMDALSSYALTVPTFRGCSYTGADPDCMR